MATISLYVSLIIPCWKYLMLTQWLSVLCPSLHFVLHPSGVIKLHYKCLLFQLSVCLQTTPNIWWLKTTIYCFSWLHELVGLSWGNFLLRQYSWVHSHSCAQPEPCLGMEHPRWLFFLQGLLQCGSNHSEVQPALLHDGEAPRQGSGSCQYSLKARLEAPDITSTAFNCSKQITRPTQIPSNRNTPHL